ncbi:MAG: hypothetical protein A3G45_00435 [Candidatus Staskawiczbacteria bacterium RIFCSPLOWO2_12_FULL_37_15]|uniref:Nucleotidyl transferase domain-containing protein n=1 Tax=Candidatus Staskawiczbacteria bacterium RIFCSPLOWO2_12_FULL_37_15 TaxID=1802218 RepID=A0A1G2IRZ4_9BACT|nr:MAG: hypothetical protein A3G45_00435 [Candidatus Staskawiczbacteria bacterium RIFCSPLOWO2_12_FULL_37_15]
MQDNKLSLKNVTALILASGDAERLSSLNLNSPKCLIEFNGVPFIKYLMHWLRYQGMERFVITTQEKFSLSMEEFINLHAPLNTTLITEKTAVNTAHSSLAGLKTISTPTTLLIVADSIFDVDLKKMYASHKNHDALVTALVSNREGLPDYPVSVSADNQCLTMCNRESTDQDFHSASTIGLYFVDTMALMKAINLSDTEINKEPVERLLPRVYAFWYADTYYDFGTPANFEWLQKHPEFIQSRYGYLHINK